MKLMHLLVIYVWVYLIFHCRNSLLFSLILFAGLIVSFILFLFSLVIITYVEFVVCSAAELVWALAANRLTEKVCS
jgi:hypothetical protein